MFIPYFKTYSQEELDNLVKTDKSWFSVEDFSKNPFYYVTEEELKRYNKNESVESLIKQVNEMKGCYLKWNDKFWYDNINIIIPNTSDKTFFKYDYMCFTLSKLKTRAYIFSGICLASLVYWYKKFY